MQQFIQQSLSKSVLLMFFQLSLLSEAYTSQAHLLTTKLLVV